MRQFWTLLDELVSEILDHMTVILSKNLDGHVKKKLETSIRASMKDMVWEIEMIWEIVLGFALANYFELTNTFYITREEHLVTIKSDKVKAR